MIEQLNKEVRNKTGLYGGKEKVFQQFLNNIEKDNIQWKVDKPVCPLAITWENTIRESTLSMFEN